MIPSHLLHELIDLLSPLTQTTLERFTLLMSAFGNGHPILNQLKWEGSTENFLTDMLNTLDEYGESTPGKRAVWVLFESLLEPGKVGIDKQERIRVLEKVLNAPAPVSKRSGAGLSVFISYASADDEPFAERLRGDLTKHGFKVWWDRTSMSNRGLTFLQEIQQAIIEVERVILVFGPGAVQSQYVRVEWEFALSLCKPVLTLLRLGNYDLLPDALKQRDVPDFRDDSQYQAKLDYLVRQLCEPAAPLGKLVNVPPLPPQFQARQRDLKAIKDKLLVDTNKPVVVTAPSRRAGLQGLGGIGKTVLASAIAQDCDVRHSFPDGVLWVTLGQTPNLLARQADLCRALGDPPQTFADVQQGKARLSELLREKACLLVIDDLWELEHARAFEATGPRGALLITTRDERLVDDLGATKHRVDVLDEEEALTLMARWLAVGDGMPAYDELEQKAQLERLKVAMPPEAKAVAHECGYLPLALTLSAAQVRDGVAWGTLLTELQAANLDFLDSPNGSVLASLKVSIDALERENAANAHHYLELAIFPEDTAIPEAAIMTLWLHTNGLRPATAEKLLVTLNKRSLLRMEGAAPDRRIRLHDLQHDYLRLALKNMAAVHREFVEAYRQKCGGQWHKGPDDGYYFEYLAYHLCHAGQTAELYTLLTGSPDWMEAKFVACIGDSSFMADLDLVLNDFADPIADPDRLLTLAKLHAARQVIHARVSMYDNTDLATLVWLGRKTEALSHARLRAEAEKNFYGLIVIYEALKMRGQTDLTLLDEAGAVARAIQSNDSRADTLCALAEILAQAGRIDEAEVVVRAIQSNDGCASALCALAEALTQASRFDEAEVVACTVQDNGNRASALCTLAKALAQAGDSRARSVFDEAKVATRAIQNDNRRVSALCGLATALAQTGDSRASSVFDEAEVVTRNMYYFNSNRVYSLRDLAAALAQAGDSRAGSVFDEAEAMARAIPDDQHQASALYALAEVSVQMGCFDKAGVIARAIQDNDYRALALRHLAEALVQAGDPRASIVFDEVGAVARAIQDDKRRASVLCALAVALAQSGDSRASSVFDEARAVACAIQNDRCRTDVLRDLAATLAQVGDSHASSVFDEARAVARAIQDDAAHASALHELAVVLARVGYFAEAEVVARAIQGDSARAYALRTLAEVRAQADDSHASSVLDEVGAEVLAQVEHFAEARAVARAIQDDYYRADALCALAEALAQADDSRAGSVFDEAGAVAHDIQSDWHRARALVGLASAHAQVGRFEKAFCTLDQCEVDIFLGTIADWLPAFEKVKLGLSVDILREVVRIIGWARSNWRKIHELLMQP